MAIPSAASGQPWRTHWRCASRMGSRSIAMWDRLRAIPRMSYDRLHERREDRHRRRRPHAGRQLRRACSRTCPAHELGATAATGRARRAQVSTAADIDEVVMGCIGQVGPDAYNARRVAIAAGPAEERAGLHRQPPVRLGPAGDLVRRDGDALERPRLRPRRRRRVDDPDAVLRLRRPQRLQARQPGAGRRHRHDADRPVPRHPHGRDRRERRREVRRLARASRTSSPSSRSVGRPPPRREAAFAEEIVAGRGRRPQAVHRRPRTSTPSRTPPSRPSRACGPPSAKDGTVTAGNASGINDGAAAVVLARESAAAERGLTGAGHRSRPSPPRRWSPS